MYWITVYSTIRTCLLATLTPPKHAWKKCRLWFLGVYIFTLYWHKLLTNFFILIVAFLFILQVCIRPDKLLRPSFRWGGFSWSTMIDLAVVILKSFLVCKLFGHFTPCNGKHHIAINFGRGKNMCQWGSECVFVMCLYFSTTCKYWSTFLYHIASNFCWAHFFIHRNLGRILFWSHICLKF